tara:strand:- start:390 stop:974 length:585 start_codon:yes stop_codon:yes gene_type:complete
MRVFLSILILIFSFQSWTKAEDISDFEIEGISIGDSALDFFTKSEILAGKASYYKNNKYTPVELTPSFLETYSDFSFSYKTNDEKYIIERMSGIIDYNNKDIKNCLKQVDEVANEMSEIFKNYATRSDKSEQIFWGADKTGKSKSTRIAFTFDTGDIVVVACYDFSEESGYWDNLNVEVKTVTFADFQRNEAYQ